MYGNVWLSTTLKSSLPTQLGGRLSGLSPFAGLPTDFPRVLAGARLSKGIFLFPGLEGTRVFFRLGGGDFRGVFRRLIFLGLLGFRLDLPRTRPPRFAICQALAGGSLSDW